MARGPNYRGGPKAGATRREADRKHGERVYDASNAIMMWKRLAQPRPAPPEHPSNPLDGFDDDAIMLAKRGHKLALQEVQVSSDAAHNQCRSYVRHERRNFGDGCSREPLYQEFYASVESYRERWLEDQDKVGMEYADSAANGTQKGKKGKAGMSEEALLQASGGGSLRRRKMMRIKGGPTG